MLPVLLISSLLVYDGPDLHIPETELFQAARYEEVFVRPNGEIYLLNFSEARIQYYAADGSLKKNIGRKGKGPGEFTFPTYITLVNEHLYVWDMLTDLISVFSLDGAFKEHIRLPDRGLDMGRAAGGWFFFDRKLDQPKGAPSNLEWSADNFASRKKIADIRTTGWGDGSWIQSDGSNVRMTYSPLAVQPKMAISPDGSRCYLADAELFEIRVFDGKKGTLLYTIGGPDEKRIPFDEEWADEEGKDSIARMRKRHPNTQVNKLYPDFFPAIRDMRFDPAGNLVVDRWRGRPDKNHYLSTFNAKGKEVKTQYDWEFLRRLAGVAGGYAYLITYELDADSGIAKVPLAEAADFVKKYPITDWYQSRSISISN